jgi:hypothetical protein
MGYRSDVAALFYATEEKDFPVIKLWLEENFPKDTFNHAVRWFDRGMVFYEDNVKWYDTYPEIQAFDAAVSKFIDMFCKDGHEGVQGAYEFMRVGEQYDDVETDYCGDYDNLLELSRAIQTP